MSVPPKKLKLSKSSKQDWKAPEWYLDNIKDSVGSYYLEIPIGKFTDLYKLFFDICRNTIE